MCVSVFVLTNQIEACSDVILRPHSRTRLTDFNLEFPIEKSHFWDRLGLSDLKKKDLKNSVANKGKPKFRVHQEALL